MEKNIPNKLLEEILLFIDYSVPEQDRAKAKSFAETYADNDLVLRVLRAHYRILPGEKEEAVGQVCTLAHKQDNYLFVVQASTFASLYLTSIDNVVWLGEYGQEVDPEVIYYFDFKDQKEFLQACRPVKELQDTGPDPGALQTVFCPVCGVMEGEHHLFGCLVEVCPWCDGQLNVCNCRFDQLERDEIENDQQLEEFYELLSAKGRIAYSKDQAPSYPGTSQGLDGKSGSK